MFSFNRSLRAVGFAITVGILLLGVPGLVPAAEGAPAPSVPDQLDADGNEAVQTALLAWALGEHPELAASPPLQWIAWQIEGLPGGAAPPEPGMGEAQEAYLRAVSEAARDTPPPRKIRIEVPATLSGQGGELRLTSQTEMIEGVPALARLYLQWSRLKASFEWVEEKPFFLPLPSDLTLPERERSNSVRQRTLLSIVLETANPVPVLRGGTFRGVSADARIESVDLIHRTERRDSGAFVADPDHILAHWTRQEKRQMGSDPAVPVDARELVMLFGGAINADRYVPENNPSSILGKAIGAVGGRVTGGAPVPSIEAALAFSAILDAGGERTIGPEAAQIALRRVVSQREAFELFSVSYLTEYGSINELQRRREFAQAEPGMRALIAARAPQLPLKVRNIVIAPLGEYDFILQGFPVKASNHGTWMPRSPVTGGEIPDLVPNFLPVPEVEAEQVLASVDRSGRMNRMVFVAVDYTLTDALARPGRSGPIHPAELPLVRLMSRVDGVTIYADPELTVPLSVQAFETDPAKAPNLLPDTLFATTGESLMGALGRLPGGHDIVLKAAMGMRDVQRAAPGQRDRMARIMTDGMIAAARADYWIGVKWQLGAFDATKGGFTVKSASFHAVPHGEDISGIEAPKLEVGSSVDMEVLRVDPEQRAALEAHLDLARAGSIHGMPLSSYARVRPLGAGEHRGQPVLTISAPEELMLGVVAGAGWPKTDDSRIPIVAALESREENVAIGAGE